MPTCCSYLNDKSQHIGEVVKLKCPYCSSSETKVIDKRASADNSNWRRRECSNCNKRFTTYENIEPIKLKVIKKNGSVKSFDKNRIVKSIIQARSKKKLSMNQIEAIVDDIERKLLTENKEKVSTMIQYF